MQNPDRGETNFKTSSADRSQTLKRALLHWSARLSPALALGLSLAYGWPVAANPLQTNWPATPIATSSNGLVVEYACNPSTDRLQVVISGRPNPITHPEQYSNPTQYLKIGNGSTQLVIDAQSYPSGPFGLEIDGIAFSIRPPKVVLALNPHITYTVDALVAESTDSTTSVSGIQTLQSEVSFSVPSDCSAPTATATNTATATYTPTATSTSTRTSSPAPTSTSTAIFTSTATSTALPTTAPQPVPQPVTQPVSAAPSSGGESSGGGDQAPARPEPSATPIPTASRQPTATPSVTPSPTSTVEGTATPTSTATVTVTPTSTSTPLPSATPTPTSTPSSETIVETPVDDSNQPAVDPQTDMDTSQMGDSTTDNISEDQATSSDQPPADQPTEDNPLTQDS